MHYDLALAALRRYNGGIKSAQAWIHGHHESVPGSEIQLSWQMLASAEITLIIKDRLNQPARPLNLYVKETSSTLPFPALTSPTHPSQLISTYPAQFTLAHLSSP